MKIRYLTPFAGRGIPTVRAGDEVDVEPREAKRLIERGLAVPVGDASEGPPRTQKRQKATTKPPEKVVATE